VGLRRGQGSTPSLRTAALAERSGNLKQFASWTAARAFTALISGDLLTSLALADKTLETAQSGSIAPPPLSLWGLTRPEHIAFAKPRETRQPFHAFSQPIRLEHDVALARLPKTFIYCSSPATGTFDGFATKYRRDPSWLFFELKTGQDGMILVPDEVRGILLQLAQ
jgi:hypothetical protein